MLDISLEGLRPPRTPRLKKVAPLHLPARVLTWFEKKLFFRRSSEIVGTPLKRRFRYRAFTMQSETFITYSGPEQWPFEVWVFYMFVPLYLAIKNAEQYREAAINVPGRPGPGATKRGSQQNQKPRILRLFSSPIGCLKNPEKPQKLKKHHQQITRRSPKSISGVNFGQRPSGVNSPALIGVRR